MNISRQREEESRYQRKGDRGIATSEIRGIVGVLSFVVFFFFFNVYVFLRETMTECEWVRGRERGRYRMRSRLQAPSCQHRARCGAGTHEL